MKIEIFAESAEGIKKVGCSSCPKSCASRDQVVMTPGLLKSQIEAQFAEKVEVILYDYTEGNQSDILARMNDIYKANGIKRLLNPVLIGPLMNRVWPAVVVDDQLKSEGALLDLSQLQLYIS